MKKLLLSMLLASAAAVADTPTAQVDTAFYSANKAVKVVSTRQGRTYAVKGKKVLWTLREYVRYGYVSDDGRYFVEVYGGGNLIPRHPANDIVLLSFYRDGKPIKEVTLPDIVSSTSLLVPTQSHLYWGDPLGFVQAHTFALKRVDGKLFHFDLSAY
ncbi:MAG TPA: hypothetical protein VGC21_02915 [Telluria sp.]|jgi:hypothetical protein